MSTFEDFARFTGRQKSSFQILLAGTSYCDGSYHIERKTGDIYVFEYILKGTGTVTFGKEVYHPSAGDVYLLKPGKPHNYFSDAKDPWTKVWINLRGDLVRHLVGDYGLQDLTYFKGFADPHLFQKMISTIKSKELTSDQILKVVELSLHGLIVELAEHSNSMNPPSPTREADSMKDYIDNNIEKEITIKQLSDLIFLSPGRAINLFKKAYGITPYAYMLSQKMELARTLLSTTGMEIKEISARLGFCDTHYFSNYFKQSTGLSPSAYRKGL